MDLVFQHKYGYVEQECPFSDIIRDKTLSFVFVKPQQAMFISQISEWKPRSASGGRMHSRAGRLIRLVERNLHIN